MRGWELLRTGEWRPIFDWFQLRYKGVDLTFVSVEELGLPLDIAHSHGSSGGPRLHRILKTLPISPSDECLDLGCGKGGAMLTLARFPFARVDGVDISEGLVNIARENLRRMNVRNASLYHADAAEFTDLDRYTLFYMYYPFPRAVMKKVLENILESRERQPRKLTLIYNYAGDHDLIVEHGFRVEAEFDMSMQWACYVYSM